MRVAVVTPTIGAEYLAQCIQSVQNQTYSDLTHYIFLDGQGHYDKIHPVLYQESGKKTIKTIELEENVGKGWYGHRVYAACSFLVNADVICYLDEDNWFESNHVETIVSELKKGYDWVYSFRNVYNKDGEFICEDNCESLGRWPIWVSQPETPSYLIDSSSYCFSRSFLIMTGHLWHWGWGGDRRFYSIVKDQIQHKNYGCTGKHTLNYRLGGNEGSVQGEFFLQGNQIMSKQYQDKFPWKQQIR